MSIVAFRSSLVLAGVSLFVGSLNGCGSDSKTTPPPGGGSGGAAPEAGTDATTGAGGASGGGGTGGAPSAGGAADAAAASGDKSCGGGVCAGTPIAALGVAVNACCPDGDTKPACGLDLSLLGQVGVVVNPVCQAKNQPGEPSAECPDTTVTTTIAGAFTFKGCCRPDHKCGGLVNSLDVTTPITASLKVDLGCVAGDALGDGGGAKACTPAGGGDSGPAVDSGAVADAATKG